MNEQEKTNETTPTGTATKATAEAGTQAIEATETDTAETVAQTGFNADAPNFGPRVEPDPLLTADIEISEEEQRWRNDPNGRLTRKHKPAVSMERIHELQARRSEIMALGEEREQALRDGNLTKADELEKKMQRRTLKPYDQVVLRMYDAHGLLTDEDREVLRAAEARRAVKRAFERVRLFDGRYEASKKAGEAARAYEGSINPPSTSKRAERRRALREA